MKNLTETPKKETITIYFGERHFDTLNEFDTFPKLVLFFRRLTYSF